ncbi:MAG: hypothetical protein J5977_12245 [Fibrobacter sp.]|nr:hypothetical protein [Fibrobacter sp.]
MPKYAATFRILMDDKDTIRDVHNSLLQLDRDHEITELECEIKSGNALPISRKNRYIVIDLPNFVKLRKGVKTREDFWLRLISRGPLQVPETEDPIFANALDRLRVSRMSPELLKALEANMFDHHEYEAIEAEAFLKGQANGVQQEREKNNALTTKRANYLRSQNVPDSVISTMLSLK